MKRYFYFAAAAALMAACSQSDDLALSPQTVQQAVEQTPVEFGVYVGKNTTRAGEAGDVDTKNLGAVLTQRHGAKNGFGIFAYYTDDEQFSQLALPNFMYNEHVTSNYTWVGSAFTATPSAAWSYSPVKYWPNEFGTEAVSNATDYLSFFAYAPYVEVDEITGLPLAVTAKTADEVAKLLGYDDKEAWYNGALKDSGGDYSTLDGSTTPSRDQADEKIADAAEAYIAAAQNNIVHLSKNTATGDPIVKYRVDWNPATAVDLCWGVVPVTPATTTYSPITTGASTTTDGLPYLNLIKEKAAVTGKVNFQFYHALARLNVQIDTDIDIANGPGTYAGGTTDVEGIGGDATGNTVKTRVYVRSVTFDGFATEGALNLHNTVAITPLWKAFDGTSILAANSVTIYDGLQDGAEVTSKNSSEKPTGLNSKIIEENVTITTDNKIWKEDASHPGVRSAAVNLFNSTTETASIYVIPNGATPKVTIVYDVETIDPNLSGYLADGKTHGSSVENKITKSIFSPGTVLVAGKAYTIKLHLGLTSVKVDAAVQGWDDSTAAEDVTLPYND